MSVSYVDGKWSGVSKFSLTGRRYVESGVYCSYEEGSSEWRSFWLGERSNCVSILDYGGGIYLTGEHYFYLNYCPINRVRSGDVGKVVGFPDFWDSDYDYFWWRWILKYGVEYDVYKDVVKCLRNRLYDESKYVSIKEGVKYIGGGSHMIVGKKRRAGFSYKNASIGVCNYFHREGSVTGYVSYDESYVTGKVGVFSICRRYIHLPYQ